MMRLATAPMTSFPVHPAWAQSKGSSMPAHQGLGWRPPKLPHNPALGQALSPATAKVAAISVLLVPTAAAAAVSYVGFRLGTQDHGIPSVLGYIVGALAGISTVMGFLAMLGVATLPFGAQQTTEITPPSGSI